MPRTETDSLITNDFIGDLNSIDHLPGGVMIDWALVADDFINEATGKKELPAGTPVGSLASVTAGRAATYVSPRIVTTNPAIGLLASRAVEDEPSAAKTGYGLIVGGVVVETFLPGGAPASAIKTELRASGTGWVFSTQTDSRAA